jgi:hypothetical protein
LTAAVAAGIASGHETFLLTATEEDNGLVQAILTSEQDDESENSERDSFSLSLLAVNPCDEQGNDTEFSDETIEALLALTDVRFGLKPETVPDASEREMVNRRRLKQASPVYGVLVERATFQVASVPLNILEAVIRGLVSVDRVLRGDRLDTYQIVSW